MRRLSQIQWSQCFEIAIVVLTAPLVLFAIGGYASLTAMLLRKVARIPYGVGLSVIYGTLCIPLFLYFDGCSSLFPFIATGLVQLGVLHGLHMDGDWRNGSNLEYAGYPHLCLVFSYLYGVSCIHGLIL